jgi:hypothetical protein
VEDIEAVEQMVAAQQRPIEFYEKQTKKTKIVDVIEFDESHKQELIPRNNSDNMLSKLMDNIKNNQALKNQSIR